MNTTGTSRDFTTESTLLRLVEDLLTEMESALITSGRLVAEIKRETVEKPDDLPADVAEKAEAFFTAYRAVVGIGSQAGDIQIAQEAASELVDELNLASRRARETDDV
jgi:hypothetical protein